MTANLACDDVMGSFIILTVTDSAAAPGSILQMRTPRSPEGPELAHGLVYNDNHMVPTSEKSKDIICVNGSHNAFTRLNAGYTVAPSMTFPLSQLSPDPAPPTNTHSQLFLRMFLSYLYPAPTGPPLP